MREVSHRWASVMPTPVWAPLIGLVRGDPAGPPLALIPPLWASREANLQFLHGRFVRRP